MRGSEEARVRPPRFLRGRGGEGEESFVRASVRACVRAGGRAWACGRGWVRACACARACVFVTSCIRRVGCGRTVYTRSKDDVKCADQNKWSNAQSEWRGAVAADGSRRTATRHRRGGRPRTPKVHHGRTKQQISQGRRGSASAGATPRLPAAGRNAPPARSGRPWTKNVHHGGIKQ